MDEVKRFPKIRFAEYVLLVLLTCECAIGSSGRWLEIGPLSIRMAIFIVAFVVAIPIIITDFKKLLEKKIMIAVLIFGLFLCFAAINGYLKNNGTSQIISDLTSVLFLALVPAYMLIFDKREKVDRLIKITSYACFALAVFIVFVHFTIRFVSAENVRAFNSLINRMSLGGLFKFDSGIFRIYFRSSVSLILPFLYGLNQAIKKKGEKKRVIIPYLMMAFSLAALLLSYTRSLWFGFALGVVVYVIFNIKELKTISKAAVVTILGLLVFVSLSWVSYGFEGIITSTYGRMSLSYEKSITKDYKNIENQRKIELQSEQIREDRFAEVDQIIQSDPVFGNGLGVILDPSRDAVKIEYTYLDLWAKIGYLGLLSFLGVLWMPFFQLFFKRRKGEYYDSIGILACVMICFYCASIFNPYITSPIGLAFFAAFAASVDTKINNKACIAINV